MIDQEEWFFPLSLLPTEQVLALDDKEPFPFWFYELLILLVSIGVVVVRSFDNAPQARSHKGLTLIHVVNLNRHTVEVVAESPHFFALSLAFRCGCG